MFQLLAPSDRGGCEFSLEMLVLVSKLAAPELQRALAQLVQAQLVSQRDEQHYVFNHALVRDAAQF